jgi:hypothetical protein
MVCSPCWSFISRLAPTSFYPGAEETGFAVSVVELAEFGNAAGRALDREFAPRLLTAERETKYQRAAAGAMPLSQLLTPYTVGNLENSFKLKGQGSCSHDHSKNNSA